MHYLQLKAVPIVGRAMFGKLEGFARADALRSGLAFGSSFPSTALFRATSATGLDSLCDFLCVPGSLLVVSEAARKVLKRVPGVELLKVGIADPSGRAIDKKYFLANPIELVDCLDPDKTSFELQPGNPDVWAEVTDVTLAPQCLPKNRPLFRVKHATSLTLVRDDLAMLFKAAKLTGYDVSDLSTFRWP